MSKPIPSFIFHIPHMGKMIDYTELEAKMRTRRPPKVVQVIDPVTKKRLGSMHPNAALAKFR